LAKRKKSHGNGFFRVALQALDYRFSKCFCGPVSAHIGELRRGLGEAGDRFYRTDKARSRDRSGRGLGLAIVKAIIEAHHSVAAKSHGVGQGSTFLLELPIGEASDLAY
jgi:hypothetical protein